MIKTIFTCEHNRDACPHCAEKAHSDKQRLERIESELRELATGNGYWWFDFTEWIEREFPKESK